MCTLLRIHNGDSVITARRGLNRYVLTMAGEECAYISDETADAIFAAWDACHVPIDLVPAPSKKETT